MIIDSNILILSTRPEHSELLDWLATQPLNASLISKVEVFGFHRLQTYEREILIRVFTRIHLFPVTIDVIDEAIRLRQIRRMSLGDSLIAATALVHQMELYTHDLKDYMNIPGLNVRDPLTKNQ